MKNVLIPVLTAGLLVASAADAEPARYALDPDHTVVSFTVAHIGYAPTLGIFGEVSGSFSYDMDTQELSDVMVEIGSASLNTFHDARDNHVNGKDFLDTKTHPSITFTASGGTPSDAQSGTVTGDLTILGQTQPVTLNVTLNKAAEYPFGHKRFTLGLSIDAAIKRSAYGMDYGVANGLVGDDVTINIATEAMQMDN